MFGSYDKYTQCVVNFQLLQAISGPVGELTAPVTKTIVSTAQSLPAQIMSAAAVLVGVLLLVYGYRLVRPVNFVAGAYLGSVGSLVLLNIFAPALASCPAIVSVATTCGLALGAACSLKREAVLVVLGVVAGDIIGDLFYKTFLATAFPEYVAFGCIGFFAVLAGVLAGHAGDFAWKLGCAFLGADLAVNNFIKLVLVPYVPDGVKFEAFLAFRPDVTQAVQRASEYQGTLFGSPYVYGPVLVLILLTAVGTWLQQGLLTAAQKADNERLIMK